MRRLALIAAAGMILAGCGGSHASSSGPRPHSHPPVVGYSPVVVAASRLSPDLSRRRFAQLVSPTRLEIVTWGSSSCPAVPDKLVVEGRHAIRINLVVGSWTRGKLVTRPLPNGCTLHLKPTAMLVTIDPRQIAVRRPLTVRLSYYASKKSAVWTAAPLNG